MIDYWNPSSHLKRNVPCLFVRLVCLVDWKPVHLISLCRFGSTLVCADDRTCLPTVTEIAISRLRRLAVLNDAGNGRSGPTLHVLLVSMSMCRGSTAGIHVRWEVNLRMDGDGLHRGGIMWFHLRFDTLPLPDMLPWPDRMNICFGAVDIVKVEIINASMNLSI